MGILWSLINPLFMLAIYTFVFSVIFKARWGVGGDSKGEFAVVLFAGLIIHGLFAEVLNKSPQLILSNVNYVKKVVFPLEVLPVVQVVCACFNAGISFFVLFCAQFLIMGSIPWTAIFFPLIVLPFLLLTMGLSWILTSLGVFLRDVGQSISLLTSVLLFVSPIFFPAESLPEFMHPWMQINPLTFIIEQTRDVLIWGKGPNWIGLLAYLVLSLFVVAIGFRWFQKTRKGFADVL